MSCDPAQVMGDITRQVMAITAAPSCLPMMVSCWFRSCFHGNGTRFCVAKRDIVIQNKANEGECGVSEGQVSFLVPGWE